MSDDYEAWLDAEIERLRVSEMDAHAQVDDYKRDRRHKSAAAWRHAAAEINGKRLGLYAALCKYREVRK